MNIDLEPIVKNRNGWVGVGDANVYLRHSQLLIEGEYCMMIVLSSIARSSRAENVFYKRGHTRTGFMRSFMTVLEAEACKVADGIVVENILNEFLPAFFVRIGYQLLSADAEFSIPSYYKFLHAVPAPIQDPYNWTYTSPHGWPMPTT